MTDRAESSDSPGRGAVDEAVAGPPTCPHCHEVLYKRHCKYVCPQHGPIIDCSDPFR
jgi:hypothetical protein